MKSTTGEHYIALDHIRAYAAVLVVVWHFIHGKSGYPVLFDGVPSIFPLAILDEGHTGVALFMTLSGYLFSKLINDRRINFFPFIFNRILRLLPLLFLVVLLCAAQEFSTVGDLTAYGKSILYGLVLPTLPNGGWSITSEFHYYLIFPFVLWLGRMKKWLPLTLIFIALAVRWFIYQRTGEIIYVAYGTIIGRIDQFILGSVIFSYRSFFYKRHFLMALIFILFFIFYALFDSWGGFYKIPKSSPLSAVWIVLPMLEGAVYAVFIAWYESSFHFSNEGFSKILASLGSYSYSIYLLHFFVVFEAANFVQRCIMDISNFYLATVWALVFLGLMWPVGYASYRWIEAPFLRLRRPYILPLPQPLGDKLLSR